MRLTKLVFLKLHFSNATTKTRASKFICGTQKACVSQVSLPRCDNQQREVRISSQQRHEIRSQSQNVRAASVLQNVNSVSLNPAPLRLASQSYDTRLTFRSLTARVRRELKSPHPQRLEAGLFDPLPTDLKDYLTKKRSARQITSLCRCERLITTVLFDCHCKQSVFKRLSSMSVSRTRRTFSNVEYPKVTANMIGPSTTPSKTK